MAKLVRFPLEMKDGAKVRTLDELKEHGDIESVVAYYRDGRLSRWLRANYYDDIYETLAGISEKTVGDILAALGISADEAKLREYVASTAFWQAGDTKPTETTAETKTLPHSKRHDVLETLGGCAMLRQGDNWLGKRHANFPKGSITSISFVSEIPQEYYEDYEEWQKRGETEKSEKVKMWYIKGKSDKTAQGEKDADKTTSFGGGGASQKWEIWNAGSETGQVFILKNKGSLYVYSPYRIYANTSSERMFSDFINLKEITFDNFDTSKVTSMKGMFYRCENLTELNLSNFNISKVRDMSYMFSCCKNLKKLDLSNFHALYVATKKLFYGCISLETLILPELDRRLRPFLMFQDVIASIPFLTDLMRLEPFYKDCPNLKTINGIDAKTWFRGNGYGKMAPVAQQ